MEVNFSTDTPSSLPDLAAVEGCIHGLSRSDSEASSLTVDSSKDILRWNASDQPTAWTDEKHNLYLDHLEASFVKELHQSMGWVTGCSEENACYPSSSHQRRATALDHSSNFLVLQDDCLLEMNFERNRPALETLVDCFVTPDGPLEQDFRSTGKSCTISSADLQRHGSLHSDVRGKRALLHGVATSLKQRPVCHQYHLDSVGSITEISDQNFVNEDQEQRKTSLSMTKRSRTAATVASSKDQIVPFGSFHIT